MFIERIDNISDPRLEPYKHLTKFNHNEFSGIFIAEGWRVVWRLLESSLITNSVLISERRWTELEPSLKKLEAWNKLDVPVYLVSQDSGEELVGFNFHAGVLACAKRPQKVNQQDLLQKLEQQPAARILVCPRITSPENLGSAIRNASALGFDAILLGKGSVDPYSRRVVRVSMGIIFKFPVLLARDLPALLEEMNTYRWQHVALELTPDAVDLNTFKPASHLLLYIGNEADGLEVSWLNRCSTKVYIPMHNNVDSLNASTAAAITMHYLSPK